MNCDYSSLKNAYGAKNEPYKFELHVTYDPASGSTIPGPPAPVVTKEKFEMIPKPLKNWRDFRRFGNSIEDTMKPTFNILIQSLPASAYADLAASKSIFNFRDSNFTIYLGPIDIRSYPKNSTFYLATAVNPNLHNAGRIGFMENDTSRYFDYQLTVVDKNGSIITNNEKTDDNDTLYIKLNNRKSPSKELGKDKLGLIYIVVAKPNAVLPSIITSLDNIPAEFATIKSLVSFS
jgi:hypothetical protein